MELSGPVNSWRGDGNRRAGLGRPCLVSLDARVGVFRPSPPASQGQREAGESGDCTLLRLDPKADAPA
jgi:hypothetical protein